MKYEALHLRPLSLSFRRSDAVDTGWSFTCVFYATLLLSSTTSHFLIRVLYFTFSLVLDGIVALWALGYFTKTVRDRSHAGQ